uniref:C-type lectin domain-containing protein n=1 Tax=Lates calcarifer TaxID=8187 RepID=A0A4W6EB35_LATCA
FHKQLCTKLMKVLITVISTAPQSQTEGDKGGTYNNGKGSSDHHSCKVKLFIIFPKLKTFCDALEGPDPPDHTDLASVRNMEENQKVTELLPLLKRIWIGLFRDSWKWSDGSNSSFRYWITGEPNEGTENCVAADFNNSGKWEDHTLPQCHLTSCKNHVYQKYFL